MGARLRLRGALYAALLVIGLTATASGAQANEIPSPWTWTDYGLTLRDVSCSSPGVCVGVGQFGMALRSAANKLAWSKVDANLQPPDELSGIACTRDFCVAVSNRRPSTTKVISKIYESTDHGKTWSTGVELKEDGADKTRSALGVACDPAGDACYAVGPAGGVWRSSEKDPLDWEPLTVPAGDSYSRVACPAADTCVAVGGKSVGSAAIIKGRDVTSVKPSGQGLLSVACDRPTRCTATDGANFMSLNIVSKQWSIAQPFPPGATQVTSLACSGLDACTGVQPKEPEAVWTDSLSSSGGGWDTRPTGTPHLTAVGCAGSYCVAVGKAAAWFESFDGGFIWARVNEVGRFGVIQCSADLSPTCVAGGEKDLGVSRSEGELWSLPLNGVTGLNVKSVNCTGPSECLFLGKTSTMFTTDLTTFYARHPTTTDPAGTDALTCITSSPGHEKDICIGLTDSLMYTTVDGALTPWTSSTFVSDHPSSVACLPGRTNPITCLAAGRKRVILITGTYRDGKVSWAPAKYTDGASDKALEAVACSPDGDCSAVGADGVVLTNNGKDVRGEPYLRGWIKHIIPEGEPANRPLLKSVTCPADGVCLAGGVHSPDAIIASTTDDWANYSYDKIPGIETEGPTILGFGCKSIDRCVAVGDTVLVGTRK